MLEPYRITEKIAKRILLSLGYDRVRKFNYEDNKPHPWPDLVAYKGEDIHIIEVKKYNPRHYSIQNVVNRPEELTFIMLIEPIDKYYILLKPSDFWNGKAYKIKPKKVIGWICYKDICIPDFETMTYLQRLQEG